MGNSTVDEAQIILACQAIHNDPKLSLRAAAAIYGVCHVKISR